MKADLSTPEYSRFSYRWRPPLKRLRHPVQFVLAWLLLRAARLLPVRGAQAMGRWMGRALYPLARRDRGITDYQLELIYPEMPPGERQKLARQTFENLGMTVWEIFAFPNLRKNLDYWIDVRGEDVLRKAHAKGRGVILAIGHMANWEMIGLVLEKVDLPGRAVGRRLGNPGLNDLLMRSRESSRLKFFARGSKESPRQLLNSLRAGEVLVLAMDHDSRAPSVFVTFFGHTANTPRGAASLALKMDVPLVAGFDERLPDGTHRYHFLPVPVPKNLKNDTAGVKALTQSINDAFEAHVRQHPEQWTWNHRRWKRRPEENTE